MSWGLRRSSRRKSSRSPVKLDMLPVHDAQLRRQPYGTSGLVHGPEGFLYAPGGPFTQPADPARQLPARQGDETLGADAGEDQGLGPDVVPSQMKEKQWKKWDTETIPLLLQPYIHLLHETKSLRDLSKFRRQRRTPSCGCTNPRLLNVACIFFERIETLTICKCTPPALQLLNMGLFPCAPTAPSLAVDLNMLDIVGEYFVHAAPNTTAWCETLETFLGTRKYKLTTRDSLRRRFANAMKWYATLVNRKNLVVKDYLDVVRENLQYENSEPDVPLVEEAEDTPEGDQPSGKQHRPSAYLRARCPACFGGQRWHDPNEIVDAIVQVDACFKHKRRKGKGDKHDPSHMHPETVFVPKEDVSSMEEFVDSIRSRTTRVPRTSAQEPDGFEGPMKVPTSVLDECYDSFLAADEKRQKASTQLFTDTGLMALLCRHDRVLWLVNMTSAGERQHYALALLNTLFKHLPPEMRIGVLYDIGCQLHRSCIKWDFLEEFLDRITFGISVFHAYGHQWPCQMIYHPRKCQGFGLTDGEGCERFWSAIKQLIPSLRMAGYFHRIYTIDNQVKHLDEKSLQDLGHWLHRKWVNCRQRKTKAVTSLNELNLGQDVLRAEWAAQIKEQTKPLVRRSANLANKTIEEILALRTTMQSYKSDMRKLEEMLETGQYNGDMDLNEATTHRQELQSKCNRLQRTIDHKRSALDIDGRLNLTKLLNNKFLQARMNALALKKRIRSRLTQRKFELDGLERAYRHNSTSANKLRTHAETQIRRKEPGIQQLRKKYNDFCAELETLVNQGSAPRGAVVPHPIEKEGLFKLDVDDEIWQDVGLEDIEFNGDIPGWLGDDDVRDGIKYLLELDRCEEEERRLCKERQAVQEWMFEEWQCVSEAIDTCVDDDIQYQLKQHAEYLAHLVSIWRPKLILIPVTEEIPSGWGPSEEELANIRSYEFHESTQVRDNGGNEDDEEEEEEEDDDDDDEEEDDDDEEEALLEAIEESDLIGGYSDIDVFEML